MQSFVILFRGINVGGKNTISMASLKLALEEMGFEGVQTYINSGNVILKSDQSPKQIVHQIETMLPAKFKLDSELIKVLVLSDADVRKTVDEAPKGFAEAGKYHSDVIFLMDISTAEALAVFDPREGVDRIWPGNGVVYSQRLSAERTRSRLNKVMGTKAYKSMTIRTWSTVIKLLKLLEKA